MTEIQQKAREYADQKADTGNYDYAVGDQVFFGKSALELAYIAGAAELGKALEIAKKDYENAFNCEQYQQRLAMNRYFELEKAKQIIKEFMRISTASVEEYEPEYSELIEKADAFCDSIK